MILLWDAIDADNSPETSAYAFLPGSNDKEPLWFDRFVSYVMNIINHVVLQHAKWGNVQSAASKNQWSSSRKVRVANI